MATMDWNTTFGPIPKLAWDFSPPSLSEVEDEDPNGKTALSARRGRLPSFFNRLAPELQTMIWIEALEKPGLHFFSVRVPSGRGGGRTVNRDGVPIVTLSEQFHEAVAEIHKPYTTYFPKGKRSAYLAWADLCRRYNLALDVMLAAMVRPLLLESTGQRMIRIDAATDVVYLKFFRRHGGSTFYTPYPAYWMLSLDRSRLAGIRHVALEMRVTSQCIFWTSRRRHICAYCATHRNSHNRSLSSLYWLLADFLHCFDALESVYLVFPEVRQGPVDRRRDWRYTVSGSPLLDAVIRSPDRWDASPGNAFHCEGGTLREIQGTHIMLSLVPLVESLHAYYYYHRKTTVGNYEAVSRRTRSQRQAVLFKLAAWD